jgi:membrane-bound serine protease (ClpP class)
MLIIAAIVLFFLLPEPWDLVALISGLVLGVGELFLWNRTVKHQRRVVGSETLIGTDAVVLSPCRPDGQVRVEGEVWAAHCDAGASPGERVRIVGRRNLTLTVEPLG